MVGFIRGLAAWFIEHVIGDPIFASAVRSVYPKRADEIYALNIRKDDFTRTFYKDVSFHICNYMKQVIKFDAYRSGRSITLTVFLHLYKQFHSYPTGTCGIVTFHLAVELIADL